MNNLLTQIDIIHNRLSNIEQLLEILGEKKNKYEYKYEYKLAPGLSNIGNTCFHNSIAQMIYSMKDLTLFITSDKVKRQYKNGSIGINFISLLKLMLKDSHDVQNNILSDSNIIYNDIIKSNVCHVFNKSYFESEQEDAQEFLTGLLNYLLINQKNYTENEFNILPTDLCNFDESGKCTKVLKKFPNDDPRDWVFMKVVSSDRSEDFNISRVFQIKENIHENVTKKFTSLVESAQNTGNKVEKFNELVIENCSILGEEIIQEIMNLPIDKIANEDKKFDVIKKYVNLKLTPKKSIKDIFDYEMLLQRSYYIGEYLICCLKIFDNNKNKIINKITIDNTIKINNLRDNNEENIYHLVSIVAHEGSTLLGGHYVAYVRYSNIWYEYSDSVRKSLGNIDINNGFDNNTPYLVLYKKEGIPYIQNPDTIPDNMADYLVNIED